MKKKIVVFLFLSILMALSLSVNAFAMTPAPTKPPEPPLPCDTSSVSETANTASNVSEANTDHCEPITLPPPVDPTGDIGIPPREISNWLSQQIRLDVSYCEVYGTNAVTVVHLKLSDATKIIMIADQLCPTWIDENGEIWESAFNVPCGISKQLYRYLDAVSCAAAMYDVDGVATLLANYSPEELAEVYANLREAALPYQAELIDWLDGFTTTIRVPNYGTLWIGITTTEPVVEPIGEPIPVPPPVIEPVPMPVPEDDPIPAIVPIEGIIPEPTSGYGESYPVTTREDPAPNNGYNPVDAQCNDYTIVQ